MKIVYMGTPDFAVGALESLLAAGHEVVLVVTQPDKPQGRGKAEKCTPVKECALKHDIPVFQPVKIKTPDSVAYLKQFEADVFVVAAFGQILSQEILDMPKYGCINIHASLLPKYRGSAPIQWVILNKEKETGVTIMQMDAGIDTGDMLLQKGFALTGKDTGETVHDKLSALGAELIVEALRALEEGALTPVAQTEENTCYAPMLTKSIGRIDWTKDADTIDHYIRGLYPWPGTYTFLDGKKVKLFSAIPVELEQEANPGEVVCVEKDSIMVATGNGALIITELQLEGKKRMPVKDFLLGYKITPGMCFCAE